MAWNEPGGDNRDPWGKRKNEGPPDLDELFNKVGDSIRSIFGGKKPPSGQSSNSNLPVYLLLGLLVVGWFFAGIYTLDEKEQAVVMRFGKFHRTLGPGISFNPYWIDTVEREFVTEERQYTAAGPRSLMLTKDENIVQVPLTVQYNIKDIRAFVLNVLLPTETLEQATDSAIRNVVGSTNMEEVLSEGRSQMAIDVQQRLQTYLDDYGTGIRIIRVTLQRGEPPAQVKEAFDDVNAAEQDKDRLIDQAEAYRNGILPQARGQAQRMIEEANAYQGQLVEKARGEASRFQQLLAEYQRAPEVTRERLYIDAVQQVMQASSKVMVDVKGGNNMLYLPLDQLSKSTTSTPGITQVDKQQIISEILRELQRNANSRQGLR